VGRSRNAPRRSLQSQYAVVLACHEAGAAVAALAPGGAEIASQVCRRRKIGLHSLQPFLDIGWSDMPEKPNLSVEELHARMLKKRLWVVMTKAVAPPDDVRRHLKAHLEHQIALEKAGIMYGAGPATKPGETAASFGLIIIRAKDEAEARRIADSDPMHASGVRSYELFAWSLNEGRITMTLNFSDQTFGFD
jgi:hypothetical protein